MSNTVNNPQDVISDCCDSECRKYCCDSELPTPFWIEKCNPSAPLGSGHLYLGIGTQRARLSFHDGTYNPVEARMKLRSCLGAVGVLIALGGELAQAHDDGRYANSPLKSWFESLHSKSGPCCADADGMTLKDVDWDSRDGHYRVFVRGKWWAVPDEAVIKEPNRDGRTIVWPIFVWSESELETLKIRCFLPGAMT